MFTTSSTMTVMGNLVKDVEIKSFPNSQLSILRVAVDFSRKDSQSGQWINETEYYDVEFWGNIPDFVLAGLKKGKKVFIQGTLRSHEFTDKDGIKRVRWVIRANSIVAGESTSNGGQQQAAAPANTGFNPGYAQPNPGFQGAPAFPQQQPPANMPMNQPIDNGFGGNGFGGYGNGNGAW